MRLNRLSALPVFRCAALLLAIICLGGSRGFAAVLTLPEGLRAVEDEAFAGLAAVTELVIPEGMESVGSRAFADSGLTEITLPATLTAIADDAFAGCDIVAAHAPYGSDAFAYCLAQGWFLTAPWSDELHIATYNGEAFKVVNTAIDPIEFAKLTYRRCCQAPNEEGINQYGGECLNFSYYYTHCMVDGVAELSIADALRCTIGNVRYTTEKNSNSQVIMARLYDLLNTGMPQILMVEALTHAGSRHFLVVVGYRASVTQRDALRPEDLLLIDSFDGKLESMDPAIEPIDTRVLFRQNGQYRIEAARRK